MMTGKQFKLLEWLNDGVEFDHKENYSTLYALIPKYVTWTLGHGEITVEGQEMVKAVREGRDPK